MSTRRLVYLSPQIAGFDFGLQYAPNTSNGNGIGGCNLALNGSITGSGTGTGLGCTIANSGCPSLSSGPGIQDGARAINQTAIGVRYQGAFGGLGLLAYGVFMISQAADYTGLKTPAVLGTTTTPGSKFNGTYNDLEHRQRRRCGDLCWVHRRWQHHRWQDERPVGPATVGRRTNAGFPGRCEIRERTVDRGHRRRGVLGAGHGPALPASPSGRRAPSTPAWATLWRLASRCLPSISGWTRRRAATTSSPGRLVRGLLASRTAPSSTTTSRRQGFLVGNVVNF